MSLEKVMIIMVVVALAFIALSVHQCSKAIDEAGGMRNIIVEAGKEIDSIKKEISEGDHEQD